MTFKAVLNQIISKISGLIKNYNELKNAESSKNEEEDKIYPPPHKHHYHYHSPIYRHKHSNQEHHHHLNATINKKILKFCIFINFAGMIFQFIYAIITNSLALLSDTLHMFSHIFALSLSFFAIKISEFDGGVQRTYGFHRAEILAAFVNSLMSFFFAVFIVYEAIKKLIIPENIDSETLIIVAIIGLLVNGTSGILLIKADMENINIKSSFIHMMGDLLSSVAIIIGAIVLYYTNYIWIDCLLALMIAVVIAKWSYALAKDSVNILLETSPFPINQVRKIILENPLILDAHDIHISEITHNMYVLTAHLMIKKDNLEKFPELADEVSKKLLETLNIGHCTFQPEWDIKSLKKKK